MKTMLVTLALATAAVSTAQAEHYRPSVVRDTTIVGAVAGALIGGHNGDRWAEGAIIGAAAGAVVGAVVDNNNSPRRVSYRNHVEPVALVPCAPTVGTVIVSSPPVVYVERAPARRVVYVDRGPIVVSRPVIHVSLGSRHGHHRDHRHHYRRDHDHRRRHDHHRRW